MQELLLTNYLYLAINIFAVIIPFFLSLRKDVRFFNNWQKLLNVYTYVALPFILWDVWATGEGHWSFNPDYIVGPRIAGLPLEEILFFFTIPFSCLFIFQVLNERKNLLKNIFEKVAIKLNKTYLKLISLLAAGILIVSALLTPTLSYTFVVLLTSAFTLLVLAFARLDQRFFRVYIIYIVIVFFLFLTVNSVLTAIPVVSYSEIHTLGVRIGTIPVEDFFYNFSLLTSAAIVFYKTKSIKSVIKEIKSAAPKTDTL